MSADTRPIWTCGGSHFATEEELAKYMAELVDLGVPGMVFQRMGCLFELASSADEGAARGYTISLKQAMADADGAAEFAALWPSGYVSQAVSVSTADALNSMLEGFATRVWPQLY
jgi:hypothetical protein